MNLIVTENRYLLEVNDGWDSDGMATIDIDVNNGKADGMFSFYLKKTQVRIIRDSLDELLVEVR
jgi:hypothetical protein